MARRYLILALLLSIAALAGCGGRGLTWEESNAQRVTKASSYKVRPGDTLYSIAFRFGLKPQQLAQWNRLSDATLIYPGQVLRLTAPAARPGSSSTRTASTSRSRPAPKPVTPVSSWRWPTQGRVVSTFDMQSQATRTGILISGRRGQSVIAAAGGQVVYSGSGLKGYGKLIIIQHNAHYLSAYGHNAALLVAEGDSVRAGQKIATMGESAAQRPRLHFEIRRDGKPVDPLPVLPGR